MGIENTDETMRRIGFTKTGREPKRSSPGEIGFNDAMITVLVSWLIVIFFNVSLHRHNM